MPSPKVINPQAVGQDALVPFSHIVLQDQHGHHSFNVMGIVTRSVANNVPEF